MLHIALRAALPLAVIVIAGHALAAREMKRYDDVRRDVTAQCKAFRSQPGYENATTCAGYDPFGTNKPIATINRIKPRLDEAKAMLERGDAEGARVRVDEALAAAHRVQGSGLIGALVATSLVNRVLDLAEAHRDALDVRSIADRARLRVFDHPVEAERLNRMWSLAGEDFDVDFLHAAWANHEVPRIDARYRELEHAVLAGDGTRCEELSSDRGFAAITCARAPDVVRTGKRVAKLRTGS